MNPISKNENDCSCPLSAIDLSCSYEGYLWMSDRSSPIVVNAGQSLGKIEYEIHPVLYVFGTDSQPDENKLNPLKSENPFIIEGYLFDAKNNISISIKHVDGKYMVKALDLSTLPELCEEQVFLSYRMEAIKKLIFKQVWREEKDEYCDWEGNEKMQVLQPAEFVFVGFKK